MTKPKPWRGRPTPETLADMLAKRNAQYAAAGAAPKVERKPATIEAKRKCSPQATGVSLLTRGVEHRDAKMDAMTFNFKIGSRDLCKAILATGRTHGPMSEAAQIEAVEYAYNLR